MRTVFFLYALLASPAVAESATELKPLMAVPGQVVMQDDFSTAGPFNKSHWGARQATRWAVVDGVLRGQPSTAENQAAKKDHKGLEARISAPVTPAQFIAKFSVRFVGGKETAVVPFVEFGHHVCRLRFTQHGAELLAEGESVKVAEAPDFKYEPGKWYHALAEMNGDEFVIQFADGPTLHARYAGFAKPVASGASGLGLAGPEGGTVELDNVTFWTVGPEEQPEWAAKRAALSKFEPVPVKTKKPGKSKKAGAAKE